MKLTDEMRNTFMSQADNFIEEYFEDKYLNLITEYADFNDEFKFNTSEVSFVLKYNEEYYNVKFLIDNISRNKKILSCKNLKTDEIYQ